MLRLPDYTSAKSSSVVPRIIAHNNLDRHDIQTLANNNIGVRIRHCYDWGKYQPFSNQNFCGLGQNLPLERNSRQDTVKCRNPIRGNNNARPIGKS